MTNDILKYVITTLIGALIAGVIAYLKQIKNKVKENIKENKEDDAAIKGAVKMLLRADIKNNCQYYLDKGEIPVKEFEELQEEMSIYEELNGNGLCHKLFELVQDLEFIN